LLQKNCIVIKLYNFLEKELKLEMRITKGTKGIV